VVIPLLKKQVSAKPKRRRRPDRPQAELITKEY